MSSNSMSQSMENADLEVSLTTATKDTTSGGGSDHGEDTNGQGTAEANDTTAAHPPRFSAAFSNSNDSMFHSHISTMPATNTTAAASNGVSGNGNTKNGQGPTKMKATTSLRRRSPPKKKKVAMKATAAPQAPRPVAPPTPVAATLTNDYETTNMTTVECWGPAKEALEAYRQREFELKQEGRAKPDMIACKELRAKYTKPRKHGELEGVPTGLLLRNRGEAAILGIHQKIMSGIDSIKGESCYAVCLSGGYVDDDDNTDPDGIIYYTGEGGKDKKGKFHVEDQSASKSGNEALLRSFDSKLTIRVLRGQNGRYFYLGLYRCEGYTHDKGQEGFKVYKFKLVPLFKNQCVIARSIPLEIKAKRKRAASSGPSRPKAKKPNARNAASLSPTRSAKASKNEPLLVDLTQPERIVKRAAHKTTNVQANNKPKQLSSGSSQRIVKRVAHKTTSVQRTVAHKTTNVKPKVAHKTTNPVQAKKANKAPSFISPARSSMVSETSTSSNPDHIPPNNSPQVSGFSMADPLMQIPTTHDEQLSDSSYPSIKKRVAHKTTNPHKKDAP